MIVTASPRLGSLHLISAELTLSPLITPSAFEPSPDSTPPPFSGFPPPFSSPVGFPIGFPVGAASSDTEPALSRFAGRFEEPQKPPLRPVLPEPGSRASRLSAPISFKLELGSGLWVIGFGSPNS